VNEIISNVQKVREKIAEAAMKSGRRAEDIILVAATKMNDAERVRAAISAGVDVAGENRVQELMDKFDQNAYEGAPLHFIGNLQTNKVKYLIGKVALIQSVDSIKLAREIGRLAVKAGIVQDILIEINIGGEESKGGIEPDEIYGFIDEILQIEGVFVRGLMTIPPILGADNKNIAYFEKMHELFIDIKAKKYDNISMDFLSMGMSDDYYDAILHGANMVRVGTGIFGRRNYAQI